MKGQHKAEKRHTNTFGKHGFTIKYKSIQNFSKVLGVLEWQWPVHNGLKQMLQLVLSCISASTSKFPQPKAYKYTFMKEPT